MTRVYKPAVVIPELGDLGRLPDGGIVNIGGVEGPTFTVDGKALLFTDGTATDGSGPVIVPGSGVTGYEHVQATADMIWWIPHSKGTQRIQITIWDEDNVLVQADAVTIVDLNHVQINFNTAIKGRAILMLF